MHNTSSSLPFLTLLGFEKPSSHHLDPIFLRYYSCHGSNFHGLMLLFHASNSLSFLLLLLNLFFFILVKFFSYICYRAAFKSIALEEIDDEEENEPLKEKKDLIDDIILGGQDLLFCYGKSDEDNDDSLLSEQVITDSKESICCFQVEDNFVPESTYASPLEDLLDQPKLAEEADDTPINDQLTPNTPSPIVSSSENNDHNSDHDHADLTTNHEVTKLAADDFSSEKRFFVIEKTRPETHKFVQPKQVHADEGNYSESLTGESTSKSSVEWRSSAIFRDSETEYPFSSSSRRSSSRWEQYTLFRKYDEEMLFFDRLSAQKLNETESLRSIQYQPRSISERIAYKFMAKSRKSRRGGVDPYNELESAYVAQICLTWEALNWNYSNFREANAKKTSEEFGCPARVAQEFQQFEVLLQRFIETEPYEHGRRPEIFARMRISSPKLLQVPEFHECGDEENKEDMNSRIFSWEFLLILEDAIRTFMNFLKADKERPCRILRALIKKKQSAVDPNYFHLVKKTNRRKEHKLKQLGKWRKCLKKRRLKDETEMDVLMGLIDMKVVSRVLRMPWVTEEQLHWCEEKMNRVRVWDGKLQRDSSPIFFPVQ